MTDDQVVGYAVSDSENAQLVNPNDCTVEIAGHTISAHADLKFSITSKPDPVTVHVDGHEIEALHVFDDHPKRKMVDEAEPQRIREAWSDWQNQVDWAEAVTRRRVEYQHRVSRLQSLLDEITDEHPKPLPNSIESRDQLEDQLAQFSRYRRASVALSQYLSLLRSRQQALDEEIVRIVPFYGVYLRLGQYGVWVDLRPQPSVHLTRWENVPAKVGPTDQTMRVEEDDVT